MAILQDAATGKTARVFDDNTLSTRSITVTEDSRATDISDSFNINSGLITLTSANESGILYLKNNEDRDLKIDSTITIFGPSTGGASTDTTHVRVYKNPTTGTLIGGGVDADVSENRNFGSSINLAADAFKGAEGNTITDGVVMIESLISPGTRVSFNICIDIPKGKSIAVSYEPNDSNTSMKVMCAFSCHLKPTV